ncbi:MAG TPA: hypothetical protein DCF48_03565, partial [Rikenellaceae bacterium]|nr:hypothetical protein [Rikenellaceae bacterium]
MKKSILHAAMGMIFSLIVLAGCSRETILPDENGGQEIITDPTAPQVTALAITPEEVTLKPNETLQLKVTVTPEEASG